ncbi:3-dehydroquinate synthase [Corynebacterium atypicum]|uniref:3-dehydroquinate synthase n=1 Tax=Corynebacterium atypicum TaxID=191610 RepID=UPI0009FD4C43|nr:3-dehydroquinate synthase [Corynebacterium atypicum]
MNAPATIVLVGPPGAGKSTLARRLARALSIPLADTDDALARRFGKSCGEVFSELGEEAFRQAEAEIVADVLAGPGVVSLGGGAVTHPETRRLLTGYAVVWIDVTAAEGVRRTRSDNTRPILAAQDPLAHYQRLLDTRERFYAEVADIHVHTDHRQPAQVAAEILAALENLEEPASAPKAPAQVRVAGPRPYTVTIGQHLVSQVVAFIAASGAHKVGVVHQPPLSGYADKLGAELAAAGLEPILLPVADAEDGKTLAHAGALWDELGARGVGRRDLLVGLGGGAATDLAGFVAATWMRGMSVVQVPTTVLAMVDAAVGGKTGINTAAGKNLVGAFHEPAAVFVDLDFLRSLPRGELVAGSAEIIKTGFIADEQILRIFEADPVAALDVDGHLPELIYRSVAVKARVVTEDLTEANLREILNYGHTFGHAVEHEEDYRWRHGNAVAVGMMFAAYLAEGAGLIGPDVVARHRRILSSVGLPTTYAGGPFDSLRAAMVRDKKNRDGHLRFVTLDRGVGQATRLVAPAEGLLEQAWRRVHEGADGQAQPGQKTEPGPETER